MAKPSRAELEAEIKLLRRQLRGSNLASIINNLIRWGGIVAIVYFCYRSIESLAGQSTLADIGVRLIGDVRLSEVLGGLFGGSGIVYGLAQRKLRRNKVKSLENQIRILEKYIDPKRSSSGLTPTGETHPKDE